MSDAPVMSPEQVAALLASLPKDTYGSLVGQIQQVKAATEARAKRDAICGAVAVLLAEDEAELLKLIPVGKHLRVAHVAADKTGDGKDIPARLVFDIDLDGGMSATGSTRQARPRSNGEGKVVLVRFDGQEVKGATWSEVLKSLNAKGASIKVPEGSFSAHALLEGVAKRSLKGRLVIEGEVVPATVKPEGEAKSEGDEPKVPEPETK